MDFDDDEQLQIPQEMRGNKKHERRVKMLRKFREELRQKLNALSSTTQDRKRQVRGWPDVINIITQLQRTLHKYKSAGYIPERLLLGLRLGQTLNSQLPPGVHKKVLETYVLIFEIITQEDLARDLPVYSSGLFKLLPDASIDVKPLILQVITTYFISLPPAALRPCLSGVLCALLPVLDEKNDMADNVWKILNDMHDAFVQNGLQASFMQHLWEGLLHHAPSRNAGALYLASILPKSNQMEERSALTLEHFGGNENMVMHALKACLTSSSEFVVRAGLDLLTSSFMIHESGGLSRDSKVELAKCVLFLMARKELPLNRRVTKWTSGHDAVYAYFGTYAAPIIKDALVQLIETALETLQARQEDGGGGAPKKEHQLRPQALTGEQVVVKVMHHDLLGRYKEIQDHVAPVYLRLILAMKPNQREALEVLRTPVLLDCLGDYFPCRVREGFEGDVALPDGVVLTDGKPIDLRLAEHVWEVIEVEIKTPEVKRKRPLEKLLRLMWVVLLSIDNIVDRIAKDAAPKTPRDAGSPTGSTQSDLTGARRGSLADTCGESIQIIAVLADVIQAIAVNYADDLFAPPSGGGGGLTGFEEFFRAFALVTGRLLRTFHGEEGQVDPRCEDEVTKLSLKAVETLLCCCEQVRTHRGNLVRDHSGDDAAGDGAHAPAAPYGHLADRLAIGVDADWLNCVVELTDAPGAAMSASTAALGEGAKAPSPTSSTTAEEEVAFRFQKLLLRLCDSTHSPLPEAVVGVLNEKHLKRTITLLWGSVRASSRLLLAVTKQLIDCSTHGDAARHGHLNAAILDDFKEREDAGQRRRRQPPRGTAYDAAARLNDAGYMRFCTVWATTEALGFLNTGMLRDPLRMTLDTLLSPDPVEKAKGTRFLLNTSENVGRVLDPYLEILKACSSAAPYSEDMPQAACGVPKGEELKYILSALLSVITEAPNHFVARLLTTRAPEDVVDACGVFSGGAISGRTYLTILSGVCFAVMDHVEEYGEDRAALAASLLQMLFRRSVGLRLRAHVGYAVFARDEVVRRLRAQCGTGSPVLQFMLCEGLLIVLAYLDTYGGGAGRSDPELVDSFVNVSFPSPAAYNGHTSSGEIDANPAPQMYHTPPTGGVPLAAQAPLSPNLHDTGMPVLATVIAPVIDGLSEAALDLDLFSLRRWAVVFAEFLPFWRDNEKEVGQQTRAAVARLVGELLETPTPVSLDIVHELLDTLTKTGVRVYHRLTGTAGNVASAKQGAAQGGGMWADLFKAKSPTAIPDSDDTAMCFCADMEDLIVMLNRVYMLEGESAVQNVCLGLSGLNCFGEAETKRTVLSQLLNVLYHIHPAQFIKAVMTVWGAEITGNSWGPLVDKCTEAQGSLLNLLLLVPNLTFDYILTGVIDVTAVARQNKLKCYEVCAGDFLWHYLSICLVGTLDRLPKIMPMLTSWIKDMTHVHHSHIFSHVVFVKLLSRVVMKLAEVEREGSQEASAAARAYLHDKRTSKDYHELFVRLVENVPKAMLTQAWAKHEEDGAERTETALDLLTQQLRNLKDNHWLTSTDKIGPIFQNLHQQYFSLLFKLGDDLEEDRVVTLRKRAIRKIHASLRFLTEAVKVFSLHRQLRTPLLDHIHDAHFFRVDHATLALWRKLFSVLVSSDTAVKDMIQSSCSKIQLPTGVANVFGSVQKESQNRAMALRRLAFQMICSGQHLTNLLTIILEKLIESTKHYADYPKVRSHILLCFRAIMHKTDARSLAPFWPLIVTELMSILSQQSEEDYLVIEALKVIDLARVVLPSDYHMYRWIFVEAEEAGTRLAGARRVGSAGLAADIDDDLLVNDVAGHEEELQRKLASMPTSEEASMSVTPTDVSALDVQGRPRTPTIHPGFAGSQTPPGGSPAALSLTPSRSGAIGNESMQGPIVQSLEIALEKARRVPSELQGQSYASILDVLAQGVEEDAVRRAIETVAALRVGDSHMTKGLLKPFLSVPEHRYDDMLKADVVVPQLSAAFQEVSRATAPMEDLPDVVAASSPRPDDAYIVKAFDMDLAQMRYNGEFDNLAMLACARPPPLGSLDLSQHAASAAIKKAQANNVPFAGARPGYPGGVGTPVTINDNALHTANNSPTKIQDSRMSVGVTVGVAPF
eukprot:TRINITY_DN14503_c0_g1_i2.p1 TRINITY_DN14503_c0_g1~~TRINITY_DN14503_c0_g1_i2.p1  ORF type:complete len:2114 (+),score=778.83 TRINITY_DN14503_c0_g1_i2:112-6453(+)